MSNATLSKGEDKSFYTIKDLMQLLNMSHKSVWSLIMTDEIPHYRIGSRIIRIKSEDFANWLESKYSKGSINDRFQ
tara:strand:+ start:221 stop:448 length:228 start_codon:yes stop_codon:yes gene_type:complete